MRARMIAVEEQRPAVLHGVAGRRRAQQRQRIPDRRTRNRSDDTLECGERRSPVALDCRPRCGEPAAAGRIALVEAVNAAERGCGEHRFRRFEHESQASGGKRLQDRDHAVLFGALRGRARVVDRDPVEIEQRAALLVGKPVEAQGGEEQHVAGARTAEDVGDCGRFLG